VLRKLSIKEIAIALKSVKETIQEKIFINMSKRAVQMLKEDMLYMGPVRSKDVEECQQKIIDIICHLAQIGEIIIPCSRGEQ
jgi:flagellar motor switch protein FliG